MRPSDWHVSALKPAVSIYYECSFYNIHDAACECVRMYARRARLPGVHDARLDIAVAASVPRVPVGVVVPQHGDGRCEDQPPDPIATVYLERESAQCEEHMRGSNGKEMPTGECKDKVRTTEGTNCLPFIAIAAQRDTVPEWPRNEFNGFSP